VCLDWVRGVALLGDILYVLRAASFKMYAAGTLSPLRGSIHVEGMKDPTDIVACHHDRKLYIADMGCIWQVSVVDKLQHVTEKWLRTESLVGKVHVKVLSVTSQRLLVTTWPLSLCQYSTTDKRQLHGVLLPEYVKEVRHGVESLRQTFIVAHKGTSLNEEQFAVNELFKSCLLLKYHEVENNNVIIIVTVIVMTTTTLLAFLILLAEMSEVTNQQRTQSNKMSLLLAVAGVS